MKTHARAVGVVTLLIVATSTSSVTLGQENLARTGTAVQSSDYGAGQFPASAANDGNFGNFTATATDDDMATWEVDLGAPAEITRIVVHNRGDGCCQSRLRDITVSIREVPFADDPFGEEDPLYESELLNEENELGGGGTGGPPNLTVDLDEPVTGQFVRVTRLADPDLSGTGGAGNADEANVLSIGEVEVFGTLMPECPPEGDAEHGDTHCQGITIEAPFDEGPGVYLVSASGTDDTGDDVHYTFTADNGAGNSIVRGPDLIEFTEFNLSVGNWTISVTVDDSLICSDEAADSTCSEVVEILPPDGPNKALQRPSRQSSDFNANLTADKGNDGDFGNFTATASADDNATWEVDLIDDVDITSIFVHNRGDGCCQSRLRDITVSILDRSGDGETVLFETDLLNPENVLGGGGTGGPPVLEVAVDELTGGPVTGRIVRVHRTPDPDLSGTGGAGNADEPNVLSVGEVEVFDTQCTGEGEARCDGLSITGPEDDGPGLYTVTAFGTGAPIFYTFFADNGVDPPLVVGPQELDIASFTLPIGTWTISVIVGDTRRCTNDAPEATCSEVLEVEGVGRGRNVALDGVASQSSDFAPPYGAGQANDGNLGNFTATAPDDDMPTWEVELDATYPINAIVIHNRGDGCCQSRLRDITVFILAGDGTVLWESELLNEENELGGGTTDGPARLSLDIRELEGMDIEGRIVRVTRLPDPDLSGTGGAGNVDESNVMSLGEVEVFAEERSLALLKPGDVNGDGTLNLTDAVAQLGFLFSSEPIPACYVVPGSADLNEVGRAIFDFNGDTQINLTDPVASLGFLFGGDDPHTLGEGCVEMESDCASNCIE